MNSRTSITNLNNQYEFDVLCAQKSIEIFEMALKTGALPTRANLFINVLGEAIRFPFYLAIKILAALSHLLAYLTVKIRNQAIELSFSGFFHLIFLTLIQLLCPLLCTAIRMISSLIGFFSPYWALQGWCWAEKKEECSHQLVAHHWQTAMPLPPGKGSLQKDIRPANALFYLGWHRTHTIAQSASLPTHTQKLETTIRSSVLRFLQTLEQHQENGLEIKDEPISSNTNEAWKKLREAAEASDENHDWMHSFSQELTIEELHALFSDLCLWLETHCFEQTHCGNRVLLLSQVNQLKNLFSHRLKFGRASFPVS
ncbi:hypothetical protein PNK_0705 [Candidatus Protochlamydia naegleriophila]|uniref:Uncharacterized protein n=1 Tax=Candidatus Protochlamydia naegleriophila TaxID=389348 RepID=A0A0U5K2J8_9BACT|nr:hypothetical protein [Candidatus Protochlamydia naegleriophila]CUI16331.1 hypothetical protein PNK_0705 [Candidatus Protochlamydia naegleriophila]